MRAWFLFLVVACGGSSGPVTASGPPAASIAVPGPDDVQVATVNGRPVFGSCVADQIKRTPTLTKQIALQQCVDLELLAQTAETRQLATTSEVIDATRTALVRRLLDAFEARYPDPESMRTEIDAMYKQVGSTSIPERRLAHHALAKADKKASEAEHAAARQAAERLYQRLKDEVGLFPPNLYEAVAAEKAATGAKFVIEELSSTRDDPRWAAEFRGAMFGIPEVGRVSPVFKTDYGYHVVLLVELTPETPVTRQQVFDGLRRQLFVKFIDELLSKSNVQVADQLGPPAEDAP